MFTLGSFWDHLDFSSEWCWEHFGFSLESVWYHFGLSLESIWNHLDRVRNHFVTIFGPVWIHFGIILESRWYGRVIERWKIKKGVGKQKPLTRTPFPNWDRDFGTVVLVKAFCLPTPFLIVHRSVTLPCQPDLKMIPKWIETEPTMGLNLELVFLSKASASPRSSALVKGFCFPTLFYFHIVG